MKKPDSLRAALTAAVRDLERNPDKLHIFIDQGRVEATGARTLSFEYQYTLTLIVTDFADDTNALVVPILAWLREHQPEIFFNPDRRRDGFTFEAEVLNHTTVDVAVKLALSERVVVRVVGDRYQVEHAPEPVNEADNNTGWRLPVR